MEVREERLMEYLLAAGMGCLPLAQPYRYRKMQLRFIDIGTLRQHHCRMWQHSCFNPTMSCNSLLLQVDVRLLSTIR